MEYYLGDANLAKDDFFRDKIKSNKEGYIELAVFLNCNNIKKMKIDTGKIAEAITDSTDVELSKDKKMVRRTGNKELPAQTGSLKKRETKAKVKEEEKKAVEELPEDFKVERDEKGRIIFDTKDFENALIVHFSTKDQDEKADADYKVSWKDLENLIKDEFDKLKAVYSRADKYEGDLAISSYKYCKEQFKKLTSLKGKMIGGKKFDFEETTGETLKEFWQKQGGHYQYCIAPKLRMAKKQSRKTQDLKREEKAKKQKQSYTIAGVYYMDINKVKSKSRAILNIVKDGEKLAGNDEDFMKDLIKFHDKYTEKFDKFSHFEVGPHPEFNKTRCFFVVKTDGKREDFSVSKCIGNLEVKTNEE